MLLDRWFSSPKKNKQMTWQDIVDIGDYMWKNIDGVNLFFVPIAPDRYIVATHIKIGEAFPLHEHPDIYEKIVVLRGVAKVNDRTVLTVGQSEKFAAGYLHKIEAMSNQENEDLELMVILTRKYKKR